MDSKEYRKSHEPCSENEHFHTHHYWRTGKPRFPMRPAWWPENEPFPPHFDRPKKEYDRFTHRMGCAFIAIVVVIVLFVITILGIIARYTGLLEHSVRPGWLILAGLITLLAMPWFFNLGRRSFRRMSMPLLDLFKASSQVAEGDYDVNIAEKGPPEMRALVRAFNVMAARIKTTITQRRQLLADVTHELRTPLTVIRGNLEGILDGVYEADEKRLKSILEEVNILSRLVDDLRTLTLAESGTLQLHKEETNLATLMRDVIDAFRSQADSLGVELRIEESPSIEPMLLDAERIHQVLSNLIVNALRYTPSGGVIRLSYEIKPLAEGENSVAISIADNGPGIKAEDLPFVFQRYYKASDSGGMGLGLAIVKNIVEAHGGKVSVESQEGKGTKFIINLPYQPNPQVA